MLRTLLKRPAISLGARLASRTVKHLEGKVAVVTASTDGIGFAIAERLGQDGAKIVISSRKQSNVDLALQKLQDQTLTSSGLSCHVAKEEDRTKLLNHVVEEYGGIDILVLNAAVNPFYGPMFEVNEEQWDKIFDTNVKSTFLMCKQAIPLMDKERGGCIIIVSSIAGYQSLQFQGPYSVSKTALLGLVKAMATDCADMNIRVNGVAPGIIKTRFSKTLWENNDTMQDFMKGILMDRMGQPQDVSSAVAFLVSEEASYVTGETLVMSGGMQSRL